MDGRVGVKAGLRIAYSNQKVKVVKKMKVKTRYSNHSDLAAFTGYERSGASFTKLIKTNFTILDLKCFKVRIIFHFQYL